MITLLDIYHSGFFEQHQVTRDFGKNSMIVTEPKSVSGNRLTVRLDYGSETDSDTFDWHLYTRSEICELAGEVGFESLLVWADFDESKPVSSGNPRMQIVPEKGTG